MFFVVCTYFDGRFRPFFFKWVLIDGQYRQIFFYYGSLSTVDIDPILQWVYPVDRRFRPYSSMSVSNPIDRRYRPWPIDRRSIKTTYRRPWSTTPVKICTFNDHGFSMCTRRARLMRLPITRLMRLSIFESGCCDIWNQLVMPQILCCACVDGADHGIVQVFTSCTHCIRCISINTFIFHPAISFVLIQVAQEEILFDSSWFARAYTCACLMTCAPVDICYSMFQHCVNAAMMHYAVIFLLVCHFWTLWSLAQNNPCGLLHKPIWKCISDRKPDHNVGRNAASSRASFSLVVPSCYGPCGQCHQSPCVSRRLTWEQTRRRRTMWL